MSEPLRGISSDERVMNYGRAGLWGCLFHHYEWEDGIPHHTTSLTAVLLGGWADDLQCDDLHHLQRTLLYVAVPLDVERVALPRKFPHETIGELPIQGFVAASGKFMKYKLWDQARTDAFEITYGGDEAHERLNTPQGNHDQRIFDYIAAAWLSDGRVFADNMKAAEEILRYGLHAAVRAHEGGYWYEWGAKFGEYSSR